MSDSKNVLILYISLSSGHHKAAQAIEKGIRILNKDINVFAINSFNYTNPILEKIINKTYLGIIKNRPEVWEYLYDNPKVIKRTHRLKDLIHKYNSGRLKKLIDEFLPDVIVCTQAFPCGMVADYKKSFACSIPLVGVLTDFAPHSYWIYDEVNFYCVPSEYTARKLSLSGVSTQRIKVSGIPIDPAFALRQDRPTILTQIGLDTKLPTILVMGGGQGLGPIKEIVWQLNKIRASLQLIILAGTNKRLFNWLNSKLRYLKKKVLIYSYVDNVHTLMRSSDIVITKPGGLTSAEAMSQGLPIVIINPIPGQEVNNARFLLGEGVAVKAQDVEDIRLLIEELIANPYKLSQMQERAFQCAKPNAAMDIAKLLIELCDKR